MHRKGSSVRKPRLEEISLAKSGGTSKGFKGAVGVTWTGEDSGKSDSQSRDVSQGVQISGAVGVANPETFLSGSLKAGVITFAFGAQCISALELGTFPVNGKP